MRVDVLSAPNTRNSGVVTSETPRRTTQRTRGWCLPPTPASGLEVYEPIGIHYAPTSMLTVGERLAPLLSLISASLPERLAATVRRGIGEAQDLMQELCLALECDPPMRDVLARSRG